MIQSTAAAFMVALRSQLTTRFAANPNTSLRTVVVDLVQTADLSNTDRVTLISDLVSGDQTYASYGVRHDEYRIPGSIQAFSAGPDTDAAFQTAWARAAIVLDEIILELQTNPPQVGMQTEETHVDTITYQPLVAEQGGWYVHANFVTYFTARVSTA